MKKVKRLLVTTGILSIMLGSVLRLSDTGETIFEEIPNEETQTYIRKEEQTEDIPVNGIVEEVEAGTVGQPAEELPQAAGQINEFTYAEAQLLMRLAEAEAGNQGEDGMWLVMSVVMNRIFYPDYPDTVEDVIYQPHQFSSVWDLRIDEVEISPEAHRALARIEQGDIAIRIIGFETKDSTELDKYFAEAFTYRDHKFYVEK